MSNQKKVNPVRETFGWILAVIGGIPVIVVIIKAAIGFYWDEFPWMAGVFVGGCIVLFLSTKLLGIEAEKPTEDLLAKAKANPPYTPAQGQNAQHPGYGTTQQNSTVDLLATVNTNQPYTPAQNTAQSAPNPGYGSAQLSNMVFPAQPSANPAPYGSCLQCGMTFQQSVLNFCPGCGNNMA